MFLQGLENIQRMPLFSFVLVILMNYWKMVVPAEKEQESFLKDIYFE